MSEPYITTMSGIKFEFMAPKLDQFSISDIAHGLAHTCRFGGHTRPFYSVAEHSCRLALLCRPAYQLEGLMHDAAEAYIGDIPTPLKNSMGSYRHIENVIEDAISERYGLREDLPEEVKTLDLRMFATEARDLTLLDANEWRGIEPCENSITPWAMSVAEQRFLYMFEKLNRGRGGL